MQIWPAIDLRGGRCVRLQQGDFRRETVFSSDPAAMARHWLARGAERLHLVDLDGARDGNFANLHAVEAILAACPVTCQLGGGVRDEAGIERRLALGVARVVVGTRAVRDPEWFRAAVRKFPGRLALGLDARGGKVATDGWLETSALDAVELASRFAGEPLAAIVYTDIDTDGMLAGPNLEAMREMARNAPCGVIASGGVTTADDVARLARAGVEGCIIGRALYEGRLTLEDALAAAGTGTAAT